MDSKMTQSGEDISLEEGGCEHVGTTILSRDGYDVLACDSCGFTHVVPLPSLAELQAFYQDSFYASDKPQYLDSQQRDADWLRMIHDERIDTFEQMVTGAHKRVLDVGSGPGTFLVAARSRGWDGLAIEPSVHASEYSRQLGNEVITDTFREGILDQLGLFDAIHMSEVLEHIPDVKECIGRLKRVLKPGGGLCLVVPNDFNPVQTALHETFGYKPWWVAPPQHLNYFTPTSLPALLTREGFEIISVETNFPIDWFLLMGDNYIENGELGPQCHQRRKNLELNMVQAGQGELKRQLGRQLAALGFGRDLTVYARLPEE